MTDKPRLIIDLAAEQAVLGAVLANRNAMPIVSAELVPEDFWSPANRTLYETMQRLADEGCALDPVTVTAELKATDAFTPSLVPEYAAHLAETVPSAAHALDYARAVAKMGALRRLADAGRKITATVERHEGDVAATLDACEEIVSRALAQRRTSSEVLAFDAVEAVEREIRARKDGEKLARLMLGCEPIDARTRGLAPGSLVILAARPGVGKTSLALQLASHVAEGGGAVALFSLEMGRTELAERLVMQRVGIGQEAMLSGELTEKDWSRFLKLEERLRGARLWLDDSSSLTRHELRGRARRRALQHGLDLVVVDYVQLMRAGGRHENRQAEVAAISRALKALARELGCVVLAISQLNRNVEREHVGTGEERRSRPPQLSDLRESGALEQDADVVVFLYPDPRPSEGEGSTTRRTAVKVAKNRSGRVGLGRLDFKPLTTSFHSCESS
jgi:replicative DNA helicase